MIPTSPIRKVFEGVVDRRQMFRLFDRHAGRPNRFSDDGIPHAGEWFEITEADHDHMLNLLPPLWMRSGMFALSEYLAGSITSIFFALSIDGRVRCFHGYCDLADRRSPAHMRAAIVARETRPVAQMSREECLEHIWSETHDDYRGYAGADWPEPVRGHRTVIVYGRRPYGVETLLEDLGDAEIAAKLPLLRCDFTEALAA